MSEYELSLLRQRGIEARDGKARRGALRFTLPPGYCWSEDGRIEIDPDERVSGAIRMVFAKYRELGSARQLFLWARGAGITLPVVQRNLTLCKIAWRAPAYHTVVQILHNPITPAPMPSPGAATASASRTAARARRAVTTARCRSGAP